MPNIKREATILAGEVEVDIDAPRAKRHKPGQPSISAASPTNEDYSISSAVQNGGGDAAGEGLRVKEDPETVKERGLKLWQAIKDATSKEGRVLSHDFLRLPSKRQYPDYYQQIKRPVALDDIKRQLERGQYAFFDEVKQDFEQCFKNAKKYNMRESQIWQDAKHLHKLVLKESGKLADRKDDGDGGDGGSGSDAEEGDEKKRLVALNRLLKQKLQRLTSKSDDSGRVLAAEFMELPSKKQWPSYYKLIKQPQCFDNIFKRLKKKQYETTLEFANDVELIFSNAFEFNQEHTQIWEDAVVLRDHFRRLMATLKPPSTVPPADSSTRIKLKVPAASHVAIGSTSQSTASPKLTIPASAIHTMNPPVAFAAPSPGVLSTARNAGTPLPLAPVLSAAPSQSSTHSSQVPTPAPQPSYPQTTANGPSSQYYPNATYQAAPTASSYAARYTKPNGNFQALVPYPPSAAAPVTTLAKSPTPVDEQNLRKLRCVSVMTRPSGRLFRLDQKDGVKSWSVRLGRGETGVHITDVRVVNTGEDEDESDVEGKGKERERENDYERREEEEEEEEGYQHKQKRGRGRPRKQAKSKGGESPKGKGRGVATQPYEDVQVKLNGTTVNPEEGEPPTWEVQLVLGSNLVEVGEPHGQTWKLYLERMF